MGTFCRRMSRQRRKTRLFSRPYSKPLYCVQLLHHFGFWNHFCHLLTILWLRFCPTGRCSYHQLVSALLSTARSWFQLLVSEMDCRHTARHRDIPYEIIIIIIIVIVMNVLCGIQYVCFCRCRNTHSQCAVTVIARRTQLKFCSSTASLSTTANRLKVSDSFVALNTLLWQQKNFAVRQDER